MDYGFDKIKEQLKTNSYLVKNEGSIIKILSRYNALLFTVISMLIGLFLIGYGIVGDYRIGILGVVLFITPLIHGKYRYPTRSIFNNHRKTLSLYYNSWIPIIINYDSIEGLLEDRKIQNTTACPFRKGTKKLVYRYYIKLSICYPDSLR